MLTGPAFNALLKTLEEPPQHAVFVLATTEFEKLPPTITSRTQRFLFRKLGKKDILAKLKMIVKAENISADEDALELIAAAAEGSLRDAESLLDQLSSLEDKIDLGSAERIIGRTGFQKVERLAELILKKDAKEALAFIETVNEEGLNLIQMTKDLIHYLRKIMTLSLNPETEPLFSGDLTKEEMVRLNQFAKSARPEMLTPIIRALIRAYGEMRYSPFAIVPLEVALVEELSK